MKKREFKKEKGYDFDLYVWKKRVDTDIGVFKVELQVNRKESITEQMLAILANLIEVGTSNIGQIRGLIHQSYKDACTNDPGWVEDICGIPLNLKEGEVIRRVTNLCFTIASDSTTPEGFDSYVHIITPWDEEHAIFLRNEKSGFLRFDPMDA